MADQQQLAESFHALHSKGNPVILYNAWDAGSAQAVASVGAKAIASGSHGVANAFGYEDGEDFPLDLALQNTRRIVDSVDVPVTMDVESGYGQNPEAVKQTAIKVIETGVVGVNIEDQLFGKTELRPVDEQAERIAAFRQAADEAGVKLFINARTDLFKNADPASHSLEMVETALGRANAYADAGANGFFVPGLRDLELIQVLCERLPLPVNIIWLDGMADTKDIAKAGAARISYGPGPYLKMIEWLKQNALQAIHMESSNEQY